MGVVRGTIGDTETYGCAEIAEITAEATSTAAFCFGAKNMANCCFAVWSVTS
jgi:hypothetical protein